jgi:hypothetical protein
MRHELLYDASAEERIAALVSRGFQMQRELDEGTATLRTGGPRRAKSPTATVAPHNGNVKPRVKSWATQHQGIVPSQPAAYSVEQNPRPRARSSTKGTTTPTARQRPLSPPTMEEAPSVSSVDRREALAMRMYFQEREDRLYVERLFLLREEYHGRHHLVQSESSAFAFLTLQSSSETALRTAELQHAQKMEALSRTLEDAASVSSLRHQLHSAHEKVKVEREAVAVLQRDVSAQDRVRNDTVEAERERWAQEKLELLRRIHTLESNGPTPERRNSQLADDRFSSQLSQLQSKTPPSTREFQHKPLTSTVTLSTVDQTLARTTAALSRAQALLSGGAQS